MTHRFVLPLILLALTVPAGAANITVVEEVIAKVNGDIVTRSEYEKALAESRAFLANQKDASEQQRQQMLKEAEQTTLRNIIDERLLIQKGDDMSLNVESQLLRRRDDIMRRYNLKTVEEFEGWASSNFNMPVEDLMDQLRNNILTQAVLGQEVGSKINVPTVEIEKYYNEHKDEFVRSEGVHLQEILISTEGKTGEEFEKAKKQAEEVLGRVRKGEVFAEMARRFSKSDSSERGGDIGVFRRGSLRPEIEALVFENPSGYITDLLDVPNGFLILKVHERFKEGLAPLAEVSEEIRGKLGQPRWEPAVREYLSELRTESYIEIRPGYVDAGAVPGMDTSWSDPAKLAPLTTTKEEILKKKKRRRLLWLIPLPGGGGGKNAGGAAEAPSADAGSPPSAEEEQ